MNINTCLKLLIAILFLSSCDSRISTRSFQIGKEILNKDLLISFDENQYPLYVYLALKNEVNCDVQLDLFAHNQDSIFLVRSVKISDFIDQEYMLDFYSKPIIVSVNDDYNTDCELLDLELKVTSNRLKK